MGVLFKCLVSVGDRLEAARRRKIITQQELADAIGTDQGTISRIEAGRQSGATHLPNIARVLEVPMEWLTVGDNPPAWYVPDFRLSASLRVLTGKGHYDPNTEHNLIDGKSELSEDTILPLVGTVTAGNGMISYEEDPRPFHWKKTWSVMRVEGDSAYPVIYPGQYAIIDTSRAFRDADADTIAANNNNLVVIQVKNGADVPVKAYLKRYCAAPEAPSGYVLASVNAGRDSPFIPHERILVMVPVVGVLFEESR